MKLQLSLALLLLATCLTTAAESLQKAPARKAAAPGDWRPKVRQVGDPNANYLNVEFTASGKYMVWFEGLADGSDNGIVWHCGVNPQTGDLIPPDGRGFRAFESTSWGRANPGCDKLGDYYVGTDRAGRLLLVRPKGPAQGEVTLLATPPDPRRRAIYPTNLPSQAGGFVFFIQNERTPGAGTRANQNNWVELQYISLADPSSARAIERQDTPPVGFAPMDIGFARWMRNRPIVTFGALAAPSGKVEVRAFDAGQPERGVFDLINDGHDKIDPYPAAIGDFEYVMAGIDATATSHIYRRPAGQPADAPFVLFRTLFPTGSQLATPSLAQSHEPFVLNGRLYTTYQVNNRGRNFFDTTFRQPGEIWLVDLSANPVEQWLIAPDIPGLVAEPEPLLTAEGGAWVFYNRPVGEGALFEGRREARRTPAGSGWRRRRCRYSKGAAATQASPRFALFRADIPARAE